MGAGKICTVHFYLDCAAILTEKNQFDIFSSLAPATASKSSWPPGNQRNNHLARVTAIKPGEATYVTGFLAVARSYPCPAANIVAGYELVPTDDVTDIEWT